MKPARTLISLILLSGTVLAESNPFIASEQRLADGVSVNSSQCLTDADRKMMEQFSSGAQPGGATEVERPRFVANVNGEEVWYDPVGKTYFRKKAR